MPQFPEWAEHALNGSSHRSAEPWFPMDDDWLAGETMVRDREPPSRFDSAGTEFLDIKVEAGTGANGDRQYAPGEWVRVRCSHAQLRDWLARDDPQPGDKVAIRYVGVIKFGDGKLKKHRYVAGVAPREEVSVTAGDESTW